MKNKIHTEKEFLLNSQHFAYRLRNLYLENEDMLYQVGEYIPNSMHINSRKNLNYYYANNKMKNKSREMDTLIEIGPEYLHEISCPIFLKAALERVNLFNQLDDFDGISINPQMVQINSNMQYLHSIKLIIDDYKYFTINYFMDELGSFGKIINDVMKPIRRSNEIWQQFQSLTKQEKKILRLLANGASNKIISDKLFISTHTVHTHRKNINKKLETNNIADLVKFAMALEILK